MSLQMMCKVWDLDLRKYFPDRTDTSSIKLVLLKLGDNANDEGLAHPSIATIAEKTGLSKKAVMENIALLEKVGLVVVIREAGKRNVYLLKLDCDSSNDQSPSVTGERELPVTDGNRYQSPSVTPSPPVPPYPITVRERSETARSAISSPRGGGEKSPEAEFVQRKYAELGLPPLSDACLQAEERALKMLKQRASLDTITRRLELMLATFQGSGKWRQRSLFGTLYRNWDCLNNEPAAGHKPAADKPMASYHLPYHVPDDFMGLPTAGRAGGVSQ